MPLVATFQYAAVYLGMIVMALLGGLVTQYAGLTAAAVVFCVVYIALMSLRVRGLRRDEAIDAEQV
jgi:predicted MFS family arabinose efflux permease